MAIEKPLYLTPEQQELLESETMIEELGEDLTAELDPMSFTVNGDGELEEDLTGPPEEYEEDFDANLAEFMDEQDLMRIGQDVLEQVEADEQSRDEWKSIFADAVRLLGLTYEELQEPFPGACAATHPVLIESIVKFQAKAFGELMPPRGPVRTQVIGRVTPEKESQARRVREFMNYQITHEMTEYIPEMDNLLFGVALNGSAFKKTYFDVNLDRPVSRYVKAEDFIVSYYASDLETAERYTHKMEYPANEVRKYMVNGLYRDIDLKPYQLEEDEADEIIHEAEGGSFGFSSDEHFCLYEVHLNYDLPNYEHPDGIALPYVITVDSNSGKVLSIYRNWDENDAKYKKDIWFTHYKFVPGLGFYGYGYMHLIGGLARTATSSLRQLVDAGTFSNLPAGFKAHGMRITGAQDPFLPGEWREVNAAGLDISKALVPLPFKEPSQTLYNLLEFTVLAAQRFADATEQVLADSTNYGPVGTTMALLEASGKLFSAIHKRLHNAQKHDLKRIADINFDFLPEEYPYEVAGGQGQIFKEDFDGRIDVVPVSDPNMPSRTTRIATAQVVHSTAVQDPQNHNMREVYKEIYTALDYEEPDRFLAPLPPEPEPHDPIYENMLLLNGQPVATADWQDHEAHIIIHRTFMSDPIYAENQQMVMAMYAHLQEHLAQKYRLDMQELMGVELPPIGQPMEPEVQNQIANAATEAAKVLQQKDTLEAEAEQLEAMAMDPAIQLQQQEIALRDKEITLTHQRELAKLDIERDKLELDTLEVALDDENADEDRESKERIERAKARNKPSA